MNTMVRPGVGVREFVDTSKVEWRESGTRPTINIRFQDPPVPEPAASAPLLRQAAIEVSRLTRTPDPWAPGRRLVSEESGEMALRCLWSLGKRDDLFLENVVIEPSGNHGGVALRWLHGDDEVEITVDHAGLRSVLISEGDDDREATFPDSSGPRVLTEALGVVTGWFELT